MFKSQPVFSSLSKTTRQSQTRINEYFLELECLLSQIEQAQTHYQVFTFTPAISQAELTARYNHLLSQLFPSLDISEAFSAELLRRIEAAFQKISQAYVVLNLPARRKEYDQSLLQSRNSGQEVSPTQHNLLDITVAPSDKSRRRKERLTFITQVEVTGYEKRGEWVEVTESIDLGDNGISVYLKHPVRLGGVLYLSFRIPAVWQVPGSSDSTRKVYAIVRRSHLIDKGKRIAGLEFLGDQPPDGFSKTPWASFRTGKWTGANRRRHRRSVHNQTVFLEYQDETGQTIMLDNGITENLSARGVRIRVAPVKVRFESVRVSSWDRQFHHLGEVVDRYIGQDGQERLCLYFPDDELSL